MQSRVLKAFDMRPKILCLPLLVIILFNHALLSESSRDILEAGKYYRKELPIKTITIDDGDIYDCMKLDSQPSMKDPSIRRKIQLRKKISQQGRIRTANSSDESTSDKLRDSRVQEESERCPPGSVAVLKATKGGPLNFTAIEEFASSRARSFLKSKTIKPLDDINRSGREYAQATVQGTYGGGEGIFSVWEPRLEDNSEMSISQIWVLSETDDDDLAMSLEAGWMVNPRVYGDARTRFFIFTTNDSKDWELWVDGILIGFWPKSNYGERSATKVEWGGEVLNRRIRGRHTSTQMGSGHFSTEPIGTAAYVSNMGLYDLNLQRYDAPEEVDIGVDRPNCYNLEYWQDDEDCGNYITFGGPGYDPEDCP